MKHVVSSSQISEMCFVPGAAFHEDQRPTANLVRSYNSISIVGLGKVGHEVAHKLASDNFPLTIWNRTEGKESGFLDQNNIAIAASVVEAFRNKDVVMLCLSDGNASEEVMSAALQQLSKDERPALIINLATIDPNDAVKLDRLADNYEVSYLDVAFVGGMPSVQHRSSFFLVSGDQDAFAHGILLLQRLGSEIVFVGDRIGDSQRYKAVNQYVSAQYHIALAEAFALATEWDIPIPELKKAIFEGGSENFCINWAFQNKFDEVANGNFIGHHSITNFLKDLEISRKLIRKDLQESFPQDQRGTLEIVLACFERAVAEGRGELGHHVLYKLLMEQGYSIDVPQENRNSDFIRQHVETVNRFACCSAYALAKSMGLDIEAVERMLLCGTGSSSYLRHITEKHLLELGQSGVVLPYSRLRQESL